jgi:hypothetical protein
MVDDWYHDFSIDLLPDFFAPGNEGVEPVPDNGLINGFVSDSSEIDLDKTCLLVSGLRRDTLAIIQARTMQCSLSTRTHDIVSV